MQNFVCFKINGVKNENIKQNLEEEKEENILILLIKIKPLNDWLKVEATRHNFEMMNEMSTYNFVVASSITNTYNV